MILERGNRIFYYGDGEIILQTGEANGDILPHNENTVKYIDLEYGAVDYSKNKIIGVDVNTRQPILEAIDNETDEQKRIRELEDALLLAADAETGGIL